MEIRIMKCRQNFLFHSTSLLPVLSSIVTCDYQHMYTRGFNDKKKADNNAHR